MRVVILETWSIRVTTRSHAAASGDADELERRLVRVTRNTAGPVAEAMAGGSHLEVTR